MSCPDPPFPEAQTKMDPNPLLPCQNKQETEGSQKEREKDREDRREGGQEEGRKERQREREERMVGE